MAKGSINVAKNDDGTFTVAGSGADIWGAADAFQFVSQATSGDTQIVARVATLQNTNPYAKAGVMLRADGSAGAATVLLDVRPDGEVEFMSRAASGAAMAYLAGGTQTIPAWLKLARSGTTVSAAISANACRFDSSARSDLDISSTSAD